MEINTHDPKQKILRALEDQDTNVTFDDPLEHDMVLNMGPQHPATHGVLRILLRLDGETIVAAVSDLGCPHRRYEKRPENMSSPQHIHPTDRHHHFFALAHNIPSDAA